MYTPSYKLYSPSPTPSPLPLPMQPPTLMPLKASSLPSLPNLSHALLYPPHVPMKPPPHPLPPYLSPPPSSSCPYASFPHTPCILPPPASTQQPPSPQITHYDVFLTHTGINYKPNIPPKYINMVLFNPLKIINLPSFWCIFNSYWYRL